MEYNTTLLWAAQPRCDNAFGLSTRVPADEARPVRSPARTSPIIWRTPGPSALAVESSSVRDTATAG